jgi:hypothetical protein
MILPLSNPGNNELAGEFVKCLSFYTHSYHVRYNHYVHAVLEKHLGYVAL